MWKGHPVSFLGLLWHRPGGQVVFQTLCTPSEDPNPDPLQPYLAEVILPFPDTKSRHPHSEGEKSVRRLPTAPAVWKGVAIFCRDQAITAGRFHALTADCYRRC